MDHRTATTSAADPDAIEFVRFCYRRRRAGWPELYDEMCAVANRGLFRGYDADDLATRGIAFGLFDMPALAALASRVVEDEKALRRPVTVVITDAVALEIPVAPSALASPERAAEREPEPAHEAPIRFRVNPVAAGA